MDVIVIAVLCPLAAFVLGFGFLLARMGFALYIPPCLEFVYNISIMVGAAVLLGNPYHWKAAWTTGIATLALFFYSCKIIVDMRRAGATSLVFYDRRRNGRRVWFLGWKHIFEVAVPVLYLMLARAYSKELDAKQRHMGTLIMLYSSAVKEVAKWSNYKYWIQISILSCGAVLLGITIWRIRYLRSDDQEDLTPMETVDDEPKYWNELILRDRTQPASLNPHEAPTRDATTETVQGGVSVVVVPETSEEIRTSEAPGDGASSEREMVLAVTYYSLNPHASDSETTLEAPADAAIETVQGDVSVDVPETGEEIPTSEAPGDGASSETEMVLAATYYSNA